METTLLSLFPKEVPHGSTDYMELELNEKAKELFIGDLEGFINELKEEYSIEKLIVSFFTKVVPAKIKLTAECIYEAGDKRYACIAESDIEGEFFDGVRAAVEEGEYFEYEMKCDSCEDFDVDCYKCVIPSTNEVFLMESSSDILEKVLGGSFVLDFEDQDKEMYYLIEL